MRHRRSLPDVPHDELNVVPYLDVLMNLIVFMLLSVAGLGAWGVIRATAASPGAPGTGEAAAPWVVAIRADGFDVSRFGEGDAFIPLKDGQPDVEALGARAAAVHRTVATRKVVLAPAAGVPYATVVATMDALRAAADGEVLFPDVALALAP